MKEETVLFTMKITPMEKARLQLMADKDKRSMASYVRLLIEEKYKEAKQSIS